MPIISSVYNSRMAKEALAIQTQLNKQETQRSHITEHTNQCNAADLKFQSLKNQNPRGLIEGYSTFRQKLWKNNT